MNKTYEENLQEQYIAPAMCCYIFEGGIRNFSLPMQDEYSANDSKLVAAVSD